jgi:hypothetical protein
MQINECSCGCGGASDSCAGGSELNYMFFGNLETIKRAIDELIQMDRSQIDDILKNGHEWAVDHIASSVDDIQEVYSFLKNHVSVPVNRERNPFSEEDIFVKTFESYVNEKSNKDWREMDGDADRSMDPFTIRSNSSNNNMTWKSLTTSQRADVLLMLDLDDIEIDLANEYRSADWSDIPDYIKDRIDLQGMNKADRSDDRTLRVGDVVKYGGEKYRIERLGEPNSAGQVFHLGRSMSNNYTAASIPQRGTWEKI